MTRLKLVFIGLITLVLATVAVQNREVVTISVLIWEFEMSRVVLILLATGAGFIGGYLIAHLTGVRVRPPGGEPA